MCHTTSEFSSPGSAGLLTARMRNSVVYSHTKLKSRTAGQRQGNVSAGHRGPVSAIGLERLDYNPDIHHQNILEDIYPADVAHPSYFVYTLPRLGFEKRYPRLCFLDALVIVIMLLVINMKSENMTSYMEKILKSQF